MTLVSADEKGRLCIRGTKSGQKYLVEEAEGGWWVMPAPPITTPCRPVPRNRQEWKGSKKSLDEHLQALAEHGLRVEESKNSKKIVPPCRF